MYKLFVFPNALSISFNKLLIVFCSAYSVITITVLSIGCSSETLRATGIQEPLLEVQIYYEALCPDSQQFIRYPFYDAMITKKLFNYTEIKFIPYGKVTTWIDPLTGEEVLICQHGSRECELNALHACVVENYSKMEQLQLIDCLMGRFTIEDCSSILKINIDAALQCKSSRSVEDILEKYGNETKAIDIQYVPSIGLDGTFRYEDQNGLLQDFRQVFCKTYEQKYNVTLEECSR